MPIHIYKCICIYNSYNFYKFYKISIYNIFCSNITDDKELTTL